MTRHLAWHHESGEVEGLFFLGFLGLVLRSRVEGIWFRILSVWGFWIWFGVLGCGCLVTCGQVSSRSRSFTDRCAGVLTETVQF